MLKVAVSAIRVMVLLILSVQAVLASQAEPAPIVGDDYKEYLSGQASVYRNDQSELPFNTAVKLYREGVFASPETSDHPLTNFGLTRDEIWLAFEFSTPTRISDRAFLEVGYATLDEIDLYLVKDGKLQTMQSSGDLEPFSDKPISHRNHVFPLALSADSHYQLFLSVRSKGTLTAPVRLWQGDSLWRSDHYAYAGLSLYFGLLGALLVYNLFLFFSFRDVLYLTYVGFIFFLAIGQAGLSGLAGQFLWPDTPWLVHLSPTGGVAAAGIFGALFVHRFLGETPSRLRLRWLMPTLSIAYGLTFLTAVSGAYYPAAVAVNVLSMLFAAAALVLGAVSLWRKEPGARFFVLGWVFFLLGVLIIALHNVGVLPSNSFTTNAMLYGSAMEMLLLSLALADRTRELENLNRRLLTRQQLLEQQANQDPLTGLANRKQLQDRLAGAKTRSRNPGDSFGVVVVDLDKFKELNDSLGHRAGDEVLVAISRRLESLLRHSDTVARIGGDEFMLLLEGVRNSNDLARMKAKLAAIGDLPITLHDGTEVYVGLSSGVAMYPDDTSDIEDLYSLADADMYRVKRTRASGRGVRAFAEPIADSAER